jgi:hypothetical protein
VAREVFFLKQMTAHKCPRYRMMIFILLNVTSVVLCECGIL